MRHNAGHAAYGVLDLTQAIRVSSDDFFYNLGALLNVDPIQHPNGRRAPALGPACTGSGRPTGIDLGGETAGNLPTPTWRAADRRPCERQL